MKTQKKQNTNQVLRWVMVKLCKTFICMMISGLAFASTRSVVDLPKDSAASVVGQVSFILGKVYVDSAAGVEQLQVGSSIHVNDKITTDANGHVHIHLIDNAFVSVRPRSSLEVLEYDFNVEQPQLSTIKLNLVEGVARSISGKAAKAARDRYRMNTPIAAIGVRGTDFVVSANQQTVRALVNEGSIVVAPFSNQCAAAAFGPCSLNAVELSSGASQIIELNNTQPLPRLLPVPNDRIPELMRQQEQVVAGAQEPEENTTSNGLYLESVANRTVNDEIDAGTLLAATPPEEELPDFTPGEALASNELVQNQLVWGRWASGRGALEKITTSYAAAKSGREVTVSSDDYVLFRPEEGSQRFDQGLGLVSFQLDSAQAFFNSSTSVTPVQVNSGELEIDFEQRMFATSLDLDSVLTGKVNFSSGGELSSAGFFNTRTANQSVVGATSQDGSEAAYFFEQLLNNGSIEGLTLWGKQ